MATIWQMSIWNAYFEIAISVFFIQISLKFTQCVKLIIQLLSFFTKTLEKNVWGLLYVRYLVIKTLKQAKEKQKQ